MVKKIAFTLAEVLIALAIIGVVAAMTIPTFMANTAGAQFKTGFKKGITVLTQAAAANFATEGYDFSGTIGAHNATDFSQKPTGNNSEAIGSDTEANETSPYSDRNPNTPSLFHIFKNNLNMKNSNEVVKYAVMPVDVRMNCHNGDLTPSINGNADWGTFVSDLNYINRSGSGIQSGGGLTNLCDGNALTEDGKRGINHGYMFQLEDGMVFTYDPAQAYCTENNPCFGYIDVNGPAGPNKVIACSQAPEGSVNNNHLIYAYGGDREKSIISVTYCTVDTKDITDIYPVLFYNSIVKPASIAARSVLESKKSNQLPRSAAGGDFDY